MLPRKFSLFLLIQRITTPIGFPSLRILYDVLSLCNAHFVRNSPLSYPSGPLLVSFRCRFASSSNASFMIGVNVATSSPVNVSNCKPLYDFILYLLERVIVSCHSLVLITVAIMHQWIYLRHNNSGKTVVSKIKIIETNINQGSEY